MPDQHTTVVEDAKVVTESAGEQDTEVETIPARDDHHAESGSTRGLVIRHVLERQLAAGHGLSAQLLDTATEVSVAVAHAPAAVVGEIRDGNTLPAAFAHTGTEVRDVVAQAGSRVRTAIGEYVGHQAQIPNAVVVGAVDVTESILRGQGSVAASAIDAAFTVASAATRGAQLRDIVSGERREISTKVDAARDEIAESWDRARDQLRGAVREYDEVVVAFSNDE